MKKTSGIFLIASTLLLLAAGPVSALEVVPFRTVNRSPLVLVYGLPPAGEATLLDGGGTEAVLAADIASNFTENDTAGESIVLDGETYRYELALRLGLGKGFEIGLAVPYLAHREGYLDSFISSWHKTFNLPGGGRESAPEDRLLYRYERDGKELLRLDEETEGLGDIRLEGGWQILRSRDEKRRALALRGSLKLPTGDEDRLLGSGSTDLALWLSGTDASLLSSGRLTLYGAAGLLYLTDGDLLPDLQRHWVGFGTLGCGYAPWRPVAFKVQVDGHSSFYHGSVLDEIDSASAQLTVGGTIFFSDRSALDLGVSEDIVVNTSPDVVFHLALRRQF